MTEGPDLSRLPTGARGWREFAQRVSGIDDTAERYFLELKSDVDLNTTKGKAKVAKFVLGAANRDPDRAVRRFGGHALMVLGVDKSGVRGVASFEAKDLEKAVSKFIGVPGPMWDHEIVRLSRDALVVVVIVDPPSAKDQPWTCFSDGEEGLQNGRIYIRADGETREAKGDELRAILNRVKAQQPEADLAVDVIGVANGYVCDDEVLSEYLARLRQDLLGAYPSPPEPDVMPTPEFPSGSALSSLNGLLNSGASDRYRRVADLSKFSLFGSPIPDKRTLEEYSAQIDKWEDDCRSAWSRTLDKVAAKVWKALEIRVRNLGTTYLEDLKLVIHIEGDVDGISKDFRDRLDFTENLPKPPRRWGPTDPMARYSQMAAVNNVASSLALRPANTGPSYGIVRFRNSGSIDLTVQLRELRPLDESTSDNDDVVLVLRDHNLTELRATWKVTAKGYHRVFAGETTVAAGDIYDFTNGARGGMK